MANAGLTQERQGVVLALYAWDSGYGFTVERAEDDGTGEPNLGATVQFQVEPGQGYFVDDTPCPTAIRHYRVAHRRPGFTDSELGPWFAMKPMRIPDIMPPPPPGPLMALDLIIDDVTGECLIVVDGLFRVRSVRWALDLTDFPDSSVVQSTGTVAEVNGTAKIATGFIVPEGSQVYATVAFYDAPGAAGFFLGALRKNEYRTGAAVDCEPTLDEDNGVLNLYPGRTSSAGSVRYFVRTDGTKPTLAQVQGGTVSTADEILAIHTFTTDAEKVYVGVLAYAGTDGTGTEGPLRTRAWTYHVGDGGPQVTWRRVAPSGTDAAGKEAVEFQVTDDSDQVALWVQTVAAGAAAATWAGATHRYIDPSGAASATGYSPDPLRRVFEVVRPAPGAAGTDIVFRAEDGAGQFTQEARLRVDGDIIPSGMFTAAPVRVGEIPKVIPSSIDPDSGSWRFRVNLVDEGVDTFDLPAFTDSPSDDEFSGSTFGAPVELDPAHAVVAGKQLNVVGYFFATNSAVAAAQAVSLRSAPVYLIVRNRGSDMFDVSFNVLTLTPTTATIEGATAYRNGSATGQTLSYKVDGGAWTDAPTNPDDIVVARPAAGADSSKVTLAVKDGSDRRGMETVEIPAVPGGGGGDIPANSITATARWSQVSTTAWRIKVNVQQGPDIVSLKTAYTHPTTGVKTTGKTWDATAVETPTLEYEFTVQTTGDADVTWTITQALSKVRVYVTPVNSVAVDGQEVVLALDPPKDSVEGGTRTRDDGGTDRFHSRIDYPGAVKINSSGQVDVDRAVLWTKGTGAPGALAENHVYFRYVP